MKPRPLPIVLLPLLLGATTFAGAQPAPQGDPKPAQTKPKDPSNGAFARADATLALFDQVDALGKLLPLVLTKAQIRDILPAIEKARAKELEIKLLDADEIAKLDAESAKAVQAGVEGGIYPGKELQGRISKVTGALALRRQIAFGEMVDTVHEALVKTMDAGQLKVMASLLKPDSYDPRLKPATMSETEKQKFFVRIVFLNGTAYDLLLRMSKDK